MRVSVLLCCALVSPTPSAADQDLVAAFADGTNRCLHAVGTQSVDALDGLAERPSSLPADLGQARSVPGGLAAIKVMSAPGPTLCVVTSASGQSPEARHAIADWSQYQTSQIRTQFAGSSAPPVGDLIDANAIWCDPAGGPLMLSVGQSKPGGDMRVAVTNRLPDNMPNPCEETEDPNA